MSFFNDTAPTEIYTLSLHDALPIWPFRAGEGERIVLAAGLLFRIRSYATEVGDNGGCGGALRPLPRRRDRKSTRLNSSHANISYAVFCLKKKICLKK